MAKFLDSAGLTHLITKIKTYVLTGFVAKESGKGLSTNDYTDAANAKVNAIPESPVYTDRYVNSAVFAQDTTNNNVKLTLTRAGSDTAKVTANVPAASTTAFGVVKLTSATDSTSETLAATAKAVNAAYQLAASKTSNTGTVTQVKVGTKGYDPSSGVVSLPAYPTTLPASDVKSWAKADTKPAYTASEVGAVPASEKGAAGGVATLGSDGKVPSSQLPSYVDDVLEYDSKTAFPAEGETGKIYVAKDTNKTFRYGGTTYVEISSSDVTGIKVGTGTTISPSNGIITLPAYEAGAQRHIAPTAAEVKAALGTGSGTSKYLREDGTWQTITIPEVQALSNDDIDAAWDAA